MFAYRGVMSANLGRMKLLSLSILVLTTISFVRCYPVAEQNTLKVNIATLSNPEGRPSTDYLLGSTATLVCHAGNSTGPVSYQWSSTSTTFFAYNSSAMFNRKRLLSAADAGVHTCTVTDAHGNSGQASLEMSFEGIVAYVVDSYDQEDTILANNSAILHHPRSCLGCSVEFYCFSNSSLSGVGEVVFPDGTTHTKSIQPMVERLPFATLLVQVSNSQPMTGVFTCRLPDSNGNILETSISLFNGTIGQLTINVLLSGHTDITMDHETSALAKVECYTMNSPPTIVTWKRDGVVIDTMESSHYRTLQIVVDRREFHYRNILLIGNVLDIMGNHTFTCEIHNDAGSTHHSVHIEIPVTPKATVEVTPHSGQEGEVVTLTCQGTADPFKATDQLAPHMTADWVGPTGVTLTNESGVTLSAQHQPLHGVVRTLTINGTTFRHTGVYTCVVTLNGTDSALQSNTAEYHLTLIKNITIYESEEAIIEANLTLGALACVWERPSLPQMEWLFLWSGGIAPLTATNQTWDMEQLVCWEKTTTLHQPIQPLLIHAVVIKNMSIELSTTAPMAGRELRMSCSVVSDGPAILTWIDPSGRRVTPHSPSITLEIMDRGFSILFHSLRTSQGGVYTCVASVGGIPSAQTQQALHLLTVKIPQPVMLVKSDPPKVYPNSQLFVVCVVNISQDIDTPVRVQMRWNAPTQLYGNSRITTREERSISYMYNSTLSIIPVLFSDAGLYTCTAIIEPRNYDDSTVIGVPWATEGLEIDIYLNVSIRVDYSPPSDFSLPSPPYYRPASSVSLTCVAPPDAVPPLTYQWSSTCSSCYTSSNSSSRVTINILRSSDAGVHSCRVIDVKGHTGHAETEMRLIGAGVHIMDSSSSRSVANNTAVYHSCQSCQLTLYCYSNSTSPTASVSITAPPRRYYYYYSDPISTQQVSPSGVRLKYQYNGRSVTSGIYICNAHDSQGNQIDFSIGLYFFYQVERPEIYSSNVRYSSGSTSSIVSLECQSRNSIPTNVTWLRDSEAIDTLSDLYQTVEMVDRSRLSNSYFRSVLIVRSVAGGLGSQRYTCILQNIFGSNSRDIPLQRHVLTINMPLETVHGNSLRLVCQSEALPTEYTSRVRIQWWGPNGMTLNGRDGIAVGAQQPDASRTLSFNFLRSTMDGIYTCQFSIDYMNESYTEAKNYTLKVSGRIGITGNTVPLVVGKARSIRCSWNGGVIAQLAWYLEGLYSCPLAFSQNSSSVILYLDASSTGLNGTTFICRATDFVGSTYKKMTTLYVKDMSVDIEVRYVAPPDFDLFPPHYRPASSLTLSCTATGASDSATFHWRSTNIQSFPYAQRSNSAVSKSILTAYDSGTHTCTVTDGDGSVVSTSIKIILSGVGLYVSESFGVSYRTIANNTALSWRYGHRVNIRCYSNSTINSSTIVLPNGDIYPTYSRSTIARRHPSGIQLYTSYYTTPTSGIYTCRMTSPDGQVQDMSFGIYGAAIGVPTMLSPEYRDLTDVADMPGLGMIVCNTSGFPPTRISWSKDNVSLTVGGSSSYQQIQQVVSRDSSLYSNILILMDIHAVIGTYTYTCSVSNNAGRASRDIEVSNTVDPMLIVLASDPEYGLELSFSCIGSFPTKMYSHLVPYMTVTWSIPLEETIRMEEMIGNGASFSLNLTIPSLNETHNGVYTCQLLITLPNNTTTISKEVQYTINIKALSFATDRSPLVIGIHNEVVCRVHEPYRFMIEMILSETNQTLAIANDTSRVAAALVPDYSLNGTTILCLAHRIDGIEYENSMTILLAELTHDVTIEMSPEVPVAGGRLILTCRVTADLSTTLSWREYNSSRGYVSEATADGRTHTMTLTFDSLRMTDGGIYECLSEMSVSLAGNTSSTAILLEVEAAPPTVSIYRGRERVELDSNEMLVCNVSIIDEVNVPVMVEVDWGLPQLFSNESKVSESDVSGSGSTYSSTLAISNFVAEDSGEFSCTASVTPTSSRSGSGSGSGRPSGKTVTTTEVTRLKTQLSVSIQVDYSPPFDFSLPSPPYYHPASSVFLTCMAHNAVGTVSYLWSSTNGESFVQDVRRKTISRDILTAFDAGNHTCMATDELNNTGFDVTPMVLVGAGIYVRSSRPFKNSSVPNNTALTFVSSCYNCQLSFYCLSNSTTADYKPSIWYSSGRIYPNRTESHIVVSEFGSGLYVHNQGYYIREGIYTCDIADSNGYIIQLSIGAYRYNFVSPYIRANSFLNHIDNPTTDALATVYCNTSSYPPTRVVWKKNGIEVPIDGLKYEVYQVVTDRGGSLYHNALIIRDITGINNRPEYTCDVGNTAGFRRGTVRLNIQTVTLSLSVDVSPGSLTVYSIPLHEDFSLVCSGHITSSISLQKLGLQENICVQWSDSAGSLHNLANSTVASVSVTGSVLRSSLLFHPLSPGHDRLYTCSMTLDIPTFSTVPSDVSQYRVIFDVSYFQLKFDVVPCTALSDYEISEELERNIVETLAHFIDRECRCGFIPSMIDEGEFHCHRDCRCGSIIDEEEFHCHNDTINYRARIIGGGDTLPSHQLMGILRKWKKTDGTFVYARDRKRRVWVDTLCPLEIASLAAEVCGE